MWLPVATVKELLRWFFDRVGPYRKYAFFS
jgi:hypothetical protein